MTFSDGDDISGPLPRPVGAEKRLITDLFEDYDRLSRPRLQLKQSVTVLVDLIILQFDELVRFTLY